ncbi:MAG: polymer-forming cytoskeletal protein [Gammaproteobacteria bacterium]|jgi:cytoskeletal protein CcmA (bactofilin family)
MFRKRHRSKPEIRTLIGAGTRVDGDLVFADGLHVDGLVHGNVSTEEDRPGSLSVSEEGVIEGDVTVPDLVLDGTVKGNVEARERVELGPTAKVIGNVVYNLIEMAIGAEVNGKLIHQTPGRPEVPGVAPAAEKAGKKTKAASDATEDSLERS